MARILVLGSDDHLAQALPCFNAYFGLGYDWVLATDVKEMLEAAADVVVLCNTKPERLEGLRFLQKLRSREAFAAVPILLLTEPLSEAAKGLAREEEFVTDVSLPFDGQSFFQTLAAAVRFAAENRELLALRRDVAAAISRRDWQQARKHLVALSRVYKERGVLAKLLAEVCLGEGRYEKALGAARTALAAAPDSLAARNLEASALVKLGRMGEASDALGKTARMAQLQLENLIHWGDVYLERGQIETSETVFKQAVALDPKAERARDGLLAAQLIAGKAELDGALEQNSPYGFDLARLCNLKAIGLVAGRQFTAAECLYRNAIKLLADKHSAYILWFNLGLCSKKAGRIAEARTYFESAQREAPPGFDRVCEQLRHLDVLAASQAPEVWETLRPQPCA